ncbi:hypothetical protein CI102_299 [Trichoderma harzianum]|nr:hypothetical protein CI102_299 [Trichoderma harzianum]
MAPKPTAKCKVDARVARGATRQDRGYSRHPDFRVYGLIMPMDGPSVVWRIRWPSAGKWDTERPDERLCARIALNASYGRTHDSTVGSCVLGLALALDLQFLETALGRWGCICSSTATLPVQPENSPGAGCHPPSGDSDATSRAWLCHRQTTLAVDIVHFARGVELATYEAVIIFQQPGPASLPWNNSA